MAILSVGQITITDLNDARVASLYLEGNQAKVQAYTGETNTWNPDYSVNNLIITPHWFFGPSEATLTAAQVDYTGSTGGTKSGINYVISSNLVKGASKIIKVKVSNVTDTVTGLTSDPLEATFEVTCLESGAPGSAGENGKTYGINSDGRNIFTNSNANAIQLTPYFYDGGIEINSGITYEWTIIPTNSAFGTKTTKTVSVTRDMVDSAATVKCKMTYEGIDYYATIPIYDKVDPINVTILSSAGDQFTNHNISTKLTAKIYGVDGERDETGTKYTYTWKLYNKNGEQINWPANTGRNTTAVPTLTGKEININHNDVTYKAIILVEVSE